VGVSRTDKHAYGMWLYGFVGIFRQLKFKIVEIRRVEQVCSGETKLVLPTLSRRLCNR